MPLCPIFILVFVSAPGLLAAQQAAPNLYRATSAPQFGGEYHPSHGLTQGSDRQARYGPDLVFNNTVLSSYYSVPGQLQEWVDEGVLLDRNHDSIDQVNGMSFSYCSTDPSPNGVACTINFYNETVACQGPTHWPVADCSYQFAGLPGGPNGNLACWLIAIDFTTFECDFTTDPTGQSRFGWSTTWHQPATGPWLADGGYGVLDQFEWFDLLIPNGNAAHLGCFWFGPHAPASFGMTLFGQPAETLSMTPAQPGLNDSLHLSVNAAVQKGNTIRFEVFDGPFGTKTQSQLWVSRHRVENHLGSSFGIDAHELARYSTRIRAATSFSHSGEHDFRLPAGLRSGVYYTQAALAVGGQVSALSNALQHYVF
jgi:hypothetical protein